MATLFVDKLDPQSGTSLEIGSSGDTVSIGSGVTQTIAVNTPYFFAYRNASLSISHATWTTIIFDTAELDTASGFNTTTGKYIVPSAGKYYFEYAIKAESAAGDSDAVRLFSYGERNISATTTWGNSAINFRANYGRGGAIGGSVILNCSANDEIFAKMYFQTVLGGNVDVDYGSNRPTYILGYKLIE